MSAARAPYDTGHDSEDEDGDFADWSSEEGGVAIRSFLPPHLELPSAADAWEELRLHTGFDFYTFKTARRLLPHDAIRLVNFFRSAVKESVPGSNAVEAACTALKAAITQLTLPTCNMWKEDKWLRPVLEDDALIMDVVDTDAEDGDEGDSDALPSAAAPQSEFAAANNHELPDTLEEAHELLRGLQLQLERSRALIQAVNADDDNSSYSSRSSRSESRTRLPATQAKLAPLAKNPTSAGINDQDNDTYYFDSYAQIGIHKEMLRDKARTESYRDALLHPASALTGKTVIDVGCGTGILSMFAAKAGARKVVALDASNIINDAITIVHANDLSGTVAPVQGLAETVELSSHMGVEKADVIVSEWMGYALLYESMLNSVLCIRDKYLKPGGLMMPSTATILAAGITSQKWWDEKVTFWNDVYGFNMSCMSRYIFAEPHVEVLPESALGTSVEVVTRLEIATMAASDQDVVRSRVILVPNLGATTLYGVAIWFDVGFTAATGIATLGDGDAPPELEDAHAPVPLSAEGGQLITLTTSPAATPTHWMQTCLLLETPLKLPEECKDVECFVSMTRDAVNPREYRFLLEISGSGTHGRKQAYHMH